RRRGYLMPSGAPEKNGSAERFSRGRDREAAVPQPYDMQRHVREATEVEARRRERGSDFVFGGCVCKRDLIVFGHVVFLIWPRTVAAVAGFLFFNVRIEPTLVQRRVGGATSRSPAKPA